MRQTTSKRSFAISRSSSFVSSCIAATAVLAGCAVQLAPLYDKALVDGLTSSNAETLELIASASGGTSKDTFASREPRYSRIIGRYDALTLQAAARPAPSNNVGESVRRIVAARRTGGDAPAVPSTTAIDRIAKTVSQMRDTDRKQGLTPLEVTALRDQALIFMDQALTYEAALER